MNTTATGNTTTYTIVNALLDSGKFEVVVKTIKNGVVLREKYLTTLDGLIRVFKSRNGARKAIVRAIRASRGERGALHR